MTSERRFRQEQAARRRQQRGEWIVERAEGRGEFRVVRRMSDECEAFGWLADACGMAVDAEAASHAVMARGMGYVVVDPEADRTWRIRRDV